MRGFAPYVTQLQNLADELLTNPGAVLVKKEQIHSALNGGPAAAVRKLIPLSTQRSTGTFFTGENILERLSGTVSSTASERIFDPACGTGNLLLFQSQALPIFATVEETLEHWNNWLSGRDLHPEFISAAKARLVLSLIQRSPNIPAAPQLRTRDLFPNISVGDGLASDDFRPASRIILNPPFHKVRAPKDCSWGAGKVSAAALFLEVCLNKSEEGTKVTAILPDVLRSGSLYAKWREQIAAKVVIDRLEAFGEFDQLTDVSVFILCCTKKEQVKDQAVSWWKPAVRSTVGDLCSVSVGSVVPFRDKEIGPNRRYVQPKGLARWETVRDVKEMRRFRGTAVQTPFVVVRRNSRFEDKYRATATIIAGEGPVFVENHLVIIRPKDGTLRTCRKLVALLKKDQTNSWLNNRIRCRHLTVSAVKDIPWQN